MADFVEILALKTGVKREQAQKGLDALVMTLRERLPDEAFSTITAIIPAARMDAATAVEAFRDQLDFWGSGLPAMNQKAQPGVQTPLTNILQRLTRSGFSMQEANEFLPVVFQLLKRNLPPDVMRQIDRSVPGLSNLTALQSPGLLQRLKDLF
jgi:uncharacterized protein (DUF2267 family)